MFLHHLLALLTAGVIGRFSSTRLLDLERILKLESIREKPTELPLRYIQNACNEIGSPLGRTDRPNLQSYRGARSPNEQNWQDADDMMMLREYECLLARFGSLKTP